MELFGAARLRGKNICVALSGGGDSVALFDLLLCEAEGLGARVCAVNVEHGIRGAASRADSAFVRALCAERGVKLYSFSEDVPALAGQWGVGLEEAARRVRYSCFLKVLSECDLVATAHHAGDNAESVLFNLFRGSSLAGAGGIRDFYPAEELARNLGEPAPAGAGKGIVRPLLSSAKEEIARYLSDRGLAHCEDATNADISYDRNFLRREVLARARERFPACERALFRFSRIAREDEEFLCTLSEKYLSQADGAFLIAADAPRPLFFRAALFALSRFGVTKDVTLVHLEQAAALCQKRAGTGISLPCGVRAVREYDCVAFYLPQAAPRGEYPFSEGSFAFGGRTLEVSRGKKTGALVLDAGKLPEGCVFRTRREGDVIRKFGGGTKKLKDYLIDKKIARRERDFLPVLACGARVFAVCGVDVSEDVRVDDDGADIFSLSLTGYTSR